MLREADHVVITLPLTAATRGLFSTARLAAMKAGAHLYNVGRGGDRRFGGPAAQRCVPASSPAPRLDVTDPEPLPADSPLWQEPGVDRHCALFRPHAAFATSATRRCLLDNIGRFQRGEALLNVVDKRLGY